MFIAIVVIIIISLYFLYSYFKNINKDENKLFYWIIALIIMFPILFILLDYYNIPSKYTWIRKVDLVFWKNFLSSYVLSILTSFMAAFITIHSVKMSIKNQEIIRKEDNAKNVLPLLTIENAFNKSCGKGINIHFIFKENNDDLEIDSNKIEDKCKITIFLKNLGMRELYNLYVEKVESKFFQNISDKPMIFDYPIVYKEEFKVIDFEFYTNKSINLNEYGYEDLKDCMVFNCYFQDCYNNRYYQRIALNMTIKIYEKPLMRDHKFHVNLDDTVIITPPIKL